MTVVCLVILAGIFWGDFFLKNYIEQLLLKRNEVIKEYAESKKWIGILSSAS